jgi:hypothetical protein
MMIRELKSETDQVKSNGFNHGLRELLCRKYAAIIDLNQSKESRLVFRNLTDNENTDKNKIYSW